MPILKSCCCWRSLRKGCYVAAVYSLIYYVATIVTMVRFIDMERRYLNGELTDPESESFLQPEKITPTTVTFNIILLFCSISGVISCMLLVVGVYKDVKYLLCPWIFTVCLETIVGIANIMYLLYLQTANFDPITAFLFTMDFFILALNMYALACVVSQLQEYMQGRGTAAFDYSDQMNTVQYSARAQRATIISSASYGRRRSVGRPMPSRFDPEEFSEAPSKIITSVLAKPNRSNIKKHVQFPDEASCIAEVYELTDIEDEIPEQCIMNPLWLPDQPEAPLQDR